MKNTKKVLIVMLAAVLTFAAALPVYAAAENDPVRTRPAADKVLQELTGRDVFAFRGGTFSGFLQKKEQAQSMNPCIIIIEHMFAPWYNVPVARSY